MRRFHAGKKDVLALGCLASVLAVMAAGCPIQLPPSFIPGAGGTDFGTLNDGQGNQFQIQTDQEGGRPTKIVRNGGQSSFSIDSQSRITELVGTDGSKINFAYQQDGGADVSVTGAKILGFTLPDGNFAIPAGSLPNAKSALSRVAQATEPTTCDRITDFCEFFTELEGVFREPAIEFVVQQAAIAAPNVPSETIRAVVNEILDRYLQQVIDFCNAWNTVLDAGTNPCAS